MFPRTHQRMIGSYRIFSGMVYLSLELAGRDAFFMVVFPIDAVSVRFIVLGWCVGAWSLRWFAVLAVLLGSIFFAGVFLAGRLVAGCLAARFLAG